MDLRSLYCSPHPSCFALSSSCSSHLQQDHHDTNKINSLLEDSGTIFRIEATITGMGVPCHDTPIASIYSTPLAPLGRRDSHLSSKDATTTTSTTTDWNFNSVEPILTATHGCRWSSGGTTTTTTTRSNTTSSSTNHTNASINPPLNRLVFPILYKHVQRDACLMIRLLAFHPGTGSSEMKLIRQASFPLWDDKGRFHTGLQRIHLHAPTSDVVRVVEGEGVVEVETIKEEQIWDHHGMCQCKDEKWDAIKILEQLYTMEQEQNDCKHGEYDDREHDDGKGPTSTTTAATATATTRNTRANKSLIKRNVTMTAALEPVPWLDGLTKQWCRDVLYKNDVLSHDIREKDDDDDEYKKCQEEKNGNVFDSNLFLLYHDEKKEQKDGDHDDATTVHLIVEFPDCKVPIVHQEVLYAGGMHGASGSVTALDLALFHHEQQVVSIKHHGAKQEKVGVVECGGNSGGVGNGQQQSSSTSSWDVVLMPEPMHVNLTEDSSHAMNYRMVQFLDMECVDDNPVEDKYRTLQHELIRGLVDPALKPDASERSSLNAIISSTSQHLTREEKDLLWKFRFSLVDNKRALTKFLLAVEWTVESEVVQAAELLEQWRKRSPIEVSDALKLLGKNVAFQTGLVRSYAIDTLASAPDAELELYLLQLVQALKYEQPTIGEGESRAFGSSKMPEPSSASSLGLFLIERASKSIELANYLYWYLRVEQEDATFGERYREVFKSLKDKLSKIQNESKSGKEKRSMWDILSAQDDFISGILECQKASFHVRGKKDAKEQYLRDALNSPSCKNIRNGWDVPLPSAPHIWVKGVKAESAKMFKSAMYPALLEFFVENKSANASTYKVIVKTGDDLRQDQLVIMLIKLFDRILKRGALDLCLRPYPILAMSAVEQTGLVEFVEGSIPVSQILSNHNNSIMSFFKSVAPNDNAKYGVDPSVLQTYIRSCAGYCVITYLIGVGDRHLDNIMIQPSGHFFHIDFGFIFGRDPKPLPPAFRLTKEMVEGMGGIESDEYKQFCSLACQAFNVLRKRAGLILNLLHLMSDAGIEDLSNNPSADAEGVIAKVEERFRLELNDEQAELYFIGLINDCLAAIAPRVMDVFHQIAVARR